MIEDEVMAMDMAEYMEKHIGEEFNGFITEVYPHGMFVKTTNHITGKVKFENLRDLCEVVYLDRTEGISTTKIKEELHI